MLKWILHVCFWCLLSMHVNLQEVFTSFCLFEQFNVTYGAGKFPYSTSKPSLWTLLLATSSSSTTILKPRLRVVYDNPFSLGTSSSDDHFFDFPRWSLTRFSTACSLRIGVSMCRDRESFHLFPFFSFFLFSILSFPSEPLSLLSPFSSFLTGTPFLICFPFLPSIQSLPISVPSLSNQQAKWSLILFP